MATATTSPAITADSLASEFIKRGLGNSWLSVKRAAFLADLIARRDRRHDRAIYSGTHTDADGVRWHWYLDPRPSPINHCRYFRVERGLSDAENDLLNTLTGEYRAAQARLRAAFEKIGDLREIGLRSADPALAELIDVRGDTAAELEEIERRALALPERFRDQVRR